MPPDTDERLTRLEEQVAAMRAQVAEGRHVQERLEADIARVGAWQARLGGGLGVLIFIGMANLIKLWTV